jgi:transcriptional regulator with GAF, ATPase, and Fis domain
MRRAFEEIARLRDRLEVDNSYLREQLHSDTGLQGVVAVSDAMRYVVSKAQQVAPTESTVLLLGETGVGKSLIAQTLHQLSPRGARPLVTLNCAALPASLVESELFGHEKGAFTGAHAMRRGRFEIADGSTLFLDEIGDLPLELQGKLLRAVQDGEFERVGGNVTLKTTVRLVAATNRRLDEDVQQGRFRQDLWYRVSVFPITVPPLRHRREDIPPLVLHLVEKHCQKIGRPPLQVSKAAMKALQSREWLGNIRELENVVERAVISTRGEMFDIGEDDAATPRSSPPRGQDSADPRTLEQVERDHIVATLDRLQWRVTGTGGAADVLAINPSTLRSRMRKLGIQRPPTSSVGG